MASLSGVFNLQNFDALGNMAVGGRLYTFAPNTTTHKTAYTDAAGTVPHTYSSDGAGGQYIAMDSRGELPAPLFLSSGGYDIRYSSSAGVTVWTRRAAAADDSLYATIADLANTADAAKGAALSGYNTQLAYPDGTVGGRLRETLTTTGFANLQAAVTAAAGKTLEVFGTHTISAAITVPSNTVIKLMPGSIVQTSTADITHFDCTGESGVWINGPGKIKKTGVGTTAYVAGVLLDTATNCKVEGVEFEGMQWAGVYMKNAVNCHAINNYIHDHLGTVQDAAGVSFLENCRDCGASKNRIVNSGWHGILVQDANATPGVGPTGTIVEGNWINGTTAYGIAVYESNATDTDTLVIGNRIRNVTGVNPTGSGGAGVYVQNSGGVRVQSNVIRNVCTSTSVATLTPAGIAANNISSTLVPPSIVGNTIIDVGITEGGTLNSNAILLSGVNVSTSSNGAGVHGNIIRQSALTTPTFAGVYVNAASGVVVEGNKIKCPTTGSTSVGIFLFANGATILGAALASNEIVGGTGQYILADQTGGVNVTGLSISGGFYRGGGGTCRGIQLTSAIGVSISGVQVDAPGESLVVNGSTSVRVCSSGLRTSGAGASIFTSGTCTGGILDSSVHWGLSDGLMNNAGTGFRVEWYGGTAAPAAGTWAVGDRVIRSPAVGSPKAWSCTVAGTAGTWTSEGNL